MKFQKIWDKDSFLKPKREKRHITFKEMGIKLAPNFLLARIARIYAVKMHYF